MSNLSVRWFYTGMVLYFTTCLQCALQVTFTFQALIHFSDWVVGHAHLVMFGVFTFWLMGIMTYLFPRLLHRPWYSQTLCEWHYWLSTVGIVLMFGDLVLAGILQGYWWGSLQSWDVSIDGSRPFWIFRVFAGLMMFGGQLCFFYNIYRTWRAPVAEPGRVELAAAMA